MVFLSFSASIPLCCCRFIAGIFNLPVRANWQRDKRRFSSWVWRGNRRVVPRLWRRCRRQRSLRSGRRGWLGWFCRWRLLLSPFVRKYFCPRPWIQRIFHRQRVILPTGLFRRRRHLQELLLLFSSLLEQSWILHLWPRRCRQQRWR